MPSPATERSARVGASDPAAGAATALAGGAAALAGAATTLREAGVPEPRRDARLLLAHATRSGPEALLAEPGRALDDDDRRTFAALVARRAAREPVSRIVGRREFWSLDFRLTPQTFDPRPDSETLVEAVLEGIADRAAPLALLDLGTGSGCLLLALLSELPNAWGLGVDDDERALGAARANARALGLGGRASFVVGDWGSALDNPFNVVVTNPPYIRQQDIAALAPEVAAHEPRRALAGGDDGLAAYRALAPSLGRLLAADGMAAIEVGDGQASAVATVLGGAGLVVSSARRDLAGGLRCLVAGSEKRFDVKTRKWLESGLDGTTL